MRVFYEIVFSHKRLFLLVWGAIKGYYTLTRTQFLRAWKKVKPTECKSGGGPCYHKDDFFAKKPTSKQLSALGVLSALDSRMDFTHWFWHLTSPKRHELQVHVDQIQSFHLIAVMEASARPIEQVIDAVKCAWRSCDVAEMFPERNARVSREARGKDDIIAAYHLNTAKSVDVQGLHNTVSRGHRSNSNTTSSSSHSAMDITTAPIPAQSSAAPVQQTEGPFTTGKIKPSLGGLR